MMDDSGGSTLSQNVNVESRPKTGMQGVGGGGSNERRVKDHSFYQGQIRRHISAIYSETNRLKEEMQNMHKNASRSKDLGNQEVSVKKEVEQHEERLGTLNLLLEYLTKSEGDEVMDELRGQIQTTRSRRIGMTTEADDLLAQRKDLEVLVQSLKNERDQLERDFNTRLSNAPHEKSQIDSLSEEQVNLEAQASQLNEEASRLQSFVDEQKSEMERDLKKISYLTRFDEKVELEEHLASQKGKVEEYKNEHDLLKKSNRELMQKFKKLTVRVKGLVTERKKMNRRLQQKRKRLSMFSDPKGLYQRTHQLEEKQEKLRKLIRSIPSEKKKTQKQISRHQQLIVEVLDYVSKEIRIQATDEIAENGETAIPFIKEQFESDKDLIMEKQKQHHQSLTTLQRVKRDLEKKKKGLGNCSRIHERILKKLDRVTSHIAKMNRELEVYDRLEDLKEYYQNEKIQHKKKRSELNILKTELTKHLGRMSRQKEAAVKRLTYSNESLMNLEMKVKTLKMNNHSLMRYILEKEREMDYKNEKEYIEKDLTVQINKLLLLNTK